MIFSDGDWPVCTFILCLHNVHLTGNKTQFAVLTASPSDLNQFFCVSRAVMIEFAGVGLGGVNWEDRNCFRWCWSGTGLCYITHTPMHACVCAQAHTCAHIHIYTHTHAHIHIYTHAHTHTHTHVDTKNESTGSPFIHRKKRLKAEGNDADDTKSRMTKGEELEKQNALKARWTQRDRTVM